MPVRVTFRLPSGALCSAGHGGLIGRLPTAAVHLDDGRVSEAHAMVSLRGRDVRLLALRGRFLVAGKTLASAVLVPGLQIGLTPDLELTVETVELPEHVLALEGSWGTRVLLGVTSLFDRDPVAVEHGWRPGASVILWPVGDSWSSTQGPVQAGDVLQLGSQSVTLVMAPVQAVAATIPSPQFTVPLTIVARFDTVHLVRPDLETVVIRGINARMITELAQARAPLPWHGLAQGIWPDLDRNTVRGRWDMQLLRLRRRLRAAGIRDDLVRSAGAGLVELILGVNDTVIDEA